MEVVRVTLDVSAALGKGAPGQARCSKKGHIAKACNTPANAFARPSFKSGKQFPKVSVVGIGGLFSVRNVRTTKSYLVQVSCSEKAVRMEVDASTAVSIMDVRRVEEMGKPRITGRR